MYSLVEYKIKIKKIIKGEIMTPTTLINVTGIDFMAVLDEVVALIPTLLPVIIGFIAFRKGFAFLKSALRGA